MNINTEDRRTSTFARRAVPALAIVALALGLGACQTPQGSAVPQAPVVKLVEYPPGVDLTPTSDRVAQALERIAQSREAHLGTWTDRITAQLEYEASLTVKSTDRFKGMSADRIEEQLAREKAAAGEEFKGVPADRVVEQLQRAKANIRIQ